MPQAKSQSALCDALGTAWSELRFKRGSSGCKEVTLTEVKKEGAILPVSAQERICAIKKYINEQPIKDPSTRQVCKELSWDS